MPLDDHKFLRVDITIDGYKGNINDYNFRIDYGVVEYASSNDKNGINVTSRDDTIRGYLFYKVLLKELVF